jgi:hypothetical protein
VGAARLCEAAGVRVATLPLAAAAAVCFDGAGQPAGARTPSSPPSALREICMAQADSGFSQRVTAAWERFSSSWAEDAPLFSLTTPKT